MINKFSERLKILRMGLGLSQEKLAKSLNVSRAAVADWETRAKEPCYDILIKLAKFFNVTTDYLVGKVDEIL